VRSGEVIEINNIEFRGNRVFIEIFKGGIVSDECEVWKFEVIEIKCETLRYMLRNYMPDYEK